MKMVRFLKIGALLSFIVFMNNKLYAPEGSEEVRVELPKTEEEARKQLDELDRAIAEKTQESKKIFFSEEFVKAQKQSRIDPAAKQRFDELMNQVEVVRKSRADIQKQKDDLIKSSEIAKKVVEQKLAQEAQIQKPQQPTWMNTVVNTIKSFWANIKLTVAKVIGSKETVISIRNELSDIYTDLGPDGLLKKARNNKEIAALFDNLQDRMMQHIGVLQDYKAALDQGIVPTEQEKTINDEIQSVVTDLYETREALYEQILNARRTGEVAPIAQEDFNQFTKELDEIVSQLGISKEEQERIITAVTPAPTEPSQINQIVQNLRTGFEIEALIKGQPLEFTSDPSYKDFIRNLRKLENVNLLLLEPDQRVELVKVLSDGYKTIQRSIYEQLRENPALSPTDRQRLVDRLLLLNGKVIGMEAVYSREHENYLKANGIDNTKNLSDANQLPNQDLATKINKVIANTADTIANARHFTDSLVLKEQYDNYSKIIESYLKDLDSKPINEVSIGIRQNILDNFYTKILQNINDLSLTPQTIEPKNPDAIAAVTVDLLTKIANQLKNLEFDRSILITIQQGLQPDRPPKFALVRENDRPADEDAYAKSVEPLVVFDDLVKMSDKELQNKLNDPKLPKEYKDKVQAQIDLRIEMDKADAAAKAKLVQQELLLAVKAAPARLKSAAARGEPIKDPTIQQQLINDISKVVLQKVTTKAPLEPKDWWAEYQATGAGG